jgi:RNA polymerase sigma-70 factor (ECF subfamily)
MPDQGHTTVPGEVTRLLQAMRAGDDIARDRLVGMVYAELRRAAERALRGERQHHTLNPTDLVHEAFLKLEGSPLPNWENRAHFLGVAARAMRQVLVDHARRRAAVKRGDGWQRTTIDEFIPGREMPLDEVLALDDALERLDQQDPRLRQVVEYRFFAGMTEQEIADVLGVTERTVRRDWVKARAWLYKELYPDFGDEAEGPATTS